MSVNQSHFRYGAFTNSLLEIFDKVPVLETIMSSYTQEVFPSTSLDESSIEFEFETDRNLYLDMRDTHLSLKFQLFKGRMFDAFKKEKAEHKAKSEEDSDEEPQTYLTYVNNLLHSLFSNCEIYFNNTMVYNANGLYPHKAQISNKFNSPAVSNKGILACHGYSFEENPDAFDMYPFTDRENSLGTGINFSLYGRLAIFLFTCEKLLLPNTKVRIKLIRARPNFYMLSDNPNVSLKIVDCSLFTRRILVAEPNHQYLQWNLEREPAQYNYMETIARTFIIPSRQNQFIQENVFNNAPIRRIAVAMNTNSAVAGSFHENPFNYQQFHLRELRIIRGGRAIISLDTTSPCRPYVTTMKARQFNEDFPALPMEDFQNHYILVFDLTSLQDAAEHLHYPELSGESLRLEMFFQFPLEQVTEVIVLGERLSNVQIEKFGTVAKNV